MILVNYNIKEMKLWQLIDDFIRTGQSKKILFIVPTNRKIRELKKLVIQNSPGNATTKLNMHTLATFSSAILNESIPFTEISEAAKSVFLKRSIEKTSLKYYTNYRNPFPNGVLQKIGNVISKYKENGISPNELKKNSLELDESERLKAEDIANIYSELQEYCEKSKALELGDIYSGVVNLSDEQFQINFGNVFSDADLIVISGFSEFTNLEISILDSLRQLKNKRCILEMDYYKYNSYLFGGIDKTYSKLLQLGFLELEDLAENNTDKVINGLRQNFFKPAISTKLIKSDKIKLLRAFNREHEVEQICKSIKKLLIDKKVNPHKIAVVFNVIDNYSDYIEYEFSKYGIPLNLTDRIKLAETSPVASLINLFEISESDFYYKSIARAFNSRLLSCKEINVENLISVAKTLKVVRGYKNWISSLNNILKNTKYNSIYSEKEIESFNEAKNSIERIAQILNPFSKKLTLNEFIVSLKQTIKDLELPNKIAQNISEGSEKNIKAFATFYDLLEATFDLLSTSGSNTDKYDLNFFTEQLRLIAKNGRFNVKEKSDFGVLVTTLNEIRGLKFDHLFIGGMVDGDLPTRFTPEIFFSQNFMKQEYEHIVEERYLFYQAVSSYKNELTFTYPVSDQNREHSVSTFITELQKIISLEIVDTKPFENQIYCKDELQLLLGKIDSHNIESLFNDNFGITKDELSDINRRIMIEETRLAGTEEISEYNGYVTSGIGEDQVKLTEALLNYKSKEFSASELEVFAKCPFKYFLERILKLDIKEEPSEELEAIEIGSLLHIILYDFYTSLKKENIVLHNCSDKVFEDSLKRIFKLAKSKIDELNFSATNSFYDLEKILGIDGNQAQSILYKFVDYERNQNDDLTPQYFEVSFGSTNKTNTDSELSSFDSIDLDGVKLKGKIDRVEINETGDTFAVTDYKSGSNKPSQDDIELGLSLQLPFYLLCAQVLLKKSFGTNPEAQFMNLYSLKFSEGKFGKNPIRFGKKKDFDFIEFNKQIMEITTSNIKQFVSEISSGNFPLSKIENRKNKVCLYCDFNSQCRVDSIK